MPRDPRRPEELVGRVFRGCDALRGGLLTRKQLRSSAWRPLLHGTYVDARVPVTHRTWCTAAGLIIPPTAAVTGLSAACLYDVDLADPDAPVDVVAPREHRFGPVRGLRIRHALLPDGDRHPDGPIAVVTPLRMAWDLATNHDVVEAVVGLDAVLAAGTVRLRAVADDVRYRTVGLDPRGRGRAARRAARALALADGRAESPQESRLRVRLGLAGLPAAVPQHEVRAGGRFVARVDLAWPTQRVAVEYDGAWHGEPGQLARDRRRLNALVSAGWTVLHVTADRLGHDLDAIVAEVRRALHLSPA